MKIKPNVVSTRIYFLLLSGLCAQSKFTDYQYSHVSAARLLMRWIDNIHLDCFSTNALLLYLLMCDAYFRIPLIGELYTIHNGGP